MNNKNSICPIIKELERIYEILAEKNGLNKIAKRPIITIQTQGAKKNTLGWYWKNKWQNGKKQISEINICAENLSEKAIETLLHEMVHYHNAILNINDCNQHQYHNKCFKQRAESYGLNVEKSGRHGWNTTSISKSLQQTIKKLKPYKNVFKLHRNNTIIFKSPTKMIKYSCGCTIVRCATQLQATCEICKNKFKQE